jgi:predicted nuclease with TOPRIM domain
MDKEEATRLVEQSILFEYLMPGFKVWNFYDNGEFGTFVTQGEASISPGKLQRMLKQQLISQKDQILAERDKLSEDVILLKTNNRGLNDQLTRLDNEHTQLTGKYSLLDEQYKALEKQWNSLYFRLDLEKYLVKQGIIKQGFLKKSNLDRFTAIDFESSIDLRESKQIHVPATRFNASKIKNVVLYPRLFKKGVDYEVSMDNQGSGAVLTILNPEKLKNERVVISVGL